MIFPAVLAIFYQIDLFAVIFSHIENPLPAGEAICLALGSFQVCLATVELPLFFDLLPKRIFEKIYFFTH